LKNNVLNGHYLPIPQIYSNELSELIAKMLVIDPSKRISAGELLKEEIVINKMMNGEYLFENNIKEYNSEKANLIKTIRLPLNIKEINSKLPKKRYNPEEEMMKNDEYETMKQTFFQNLKEENNPKKEKGNFHKKNKKENGYNKGKENGSRKQLYKKNGVHEKNNNEMIKDYRIIENNNKNIINNNKSDNNNINKNYLNKREENKKMKNIFLIRKI
jgi:serine/threonine protein kinase